MHVKDVKQMRTIIMCKAPVTGRVKTRLTPPFTPEEAAQLHCSMAETVIKRASTLFSDTWIASDNISHPFFERFKLNRVDQEKGDLGDRMSRLMQWAFNDECHSVLFLGTDSPHMSDSRLKHAVALLNSFDLVIGPVEDGGYDLIAMKAPHTELFTGIQWSSEHVLQETVRQAEFLQLKTELLDMSFDLDTAESLRRAAPIWCSPLPLPEKDQEN